MTLTVDNRMLSEAGWEDIAEDVEKTNTAVVDGVDYVADEIAVMGDNLPEELRGTLGQTGEAFYDSLIRNDLSEEDRLNLLQDENVAGYLAAEETLKNAPKEEVDEALGKLKDRANALLSDSVNSPLQDDLSSEVLTPQQREEGQTLAIEITSGRDKPDVLQKTTDALGRVTETLAELQQENPEIAAAASTGLGLITGGIVREGIGYAVGVATEIATKNSETVRDALDQADVLKDKVANIAGSIIYDSESPEQFANDVAFEQDNPDRTPTELGVSSAGIKNGVSAIGTGLSMVVGIGGSKKGGGDHSEVVSSEKSGVGSGLDNTNTNSATSDVTTVRPTDSSHYSNAYEMELPSSAYPGVSRQRHNQFANESLHKSFEADSAFAAKMEAQYPGIVDGVRPGAKGAYPRTSPTSDVTWHHAPDKGKLELLPIDHHTASGPVQNTLHPDGKGGYSNWGKN
jgi:hypothetical protein